MSTQTHNPTSTGFKMFVLLAALAVAFAGFLYVLAGPSAAATVSTHNVAISEDSETLVVETTFADTGTTTDATVEIYDENSTLVTNQAVSGDNESVTARFPDLDPNATYSINVTSPDAANVSATDRWIENDLGNVSIDDDADEVVVDVYFDADATATVELYDGSGSLAADRSLTGFKTNIKTATFNESAGDYSVVVTYPDGADIQETYIQADDSTGGGVIGGGIVGGGNSTMIVGAVVLLGAAVFVARRNSA